LHVPKTARANIISFFTFTGIIYRYIVPLGTSAGAFCSETTIRLRAATHIG
jgi:hypothetical protein